MLRDWITDFVVTLFAFYTLFLLFAAFVEWRP